MSRSTKMPVYAYKVSGMADFKLSRYPPFIGSLTLTKYDISGKAVRHAFR